MQQERYSNDLTPKEWVEFKYSKLAGHMLIIAHRDIVRGKRNHLLSALAWIVHANDMNYPAGFFPFEACCEMNRVPVLVARQKLGEVAHNHGRTIADLQDSAALLELNGNRVDRNAYLLIESYLK